MTPQRFRPDDPREWLNRAHSNLAVAKAAAPGAYFEDLCFNAQQAAEKAIKGLMLHRGVLFPYIHDLERLLKLLEDSGEHIPATVKEAGRLNRFAFLMRYPFAGEPVSEDDYERAVLIAEHVVRWAEEGITGRQ